LRDILGSARHYIDLRCSFDCYPWIGWIALREMDDPERAVAPMTDWVARARAVIECEANGVRTLVEQMSETVVNVVEVLYQCRGHVLVAGAGTSHAIAQRLAHLMSCCGTPALCINAGDFVHGASGALRPEDVLYLISKGGRTAEINTLAEIARARGCTVVAQCEALDSPLAQLSDVVYQIVAPEAMDPYGMIATGSSLVNGAAGDVLCVLLLERRGYTKAQFGETHPGGAVGHKLAEEASL
jgi:arabinose-5-phosphate isomerase